jgi:hypothetical protein
VFVSVVPHRASQPLALPEEIKAVGMKLFSLIVFKRKIEDHTVDVSQSLTLISEGGRSLLLRSQ